MLRSGPMACPGTLRTRLPNPGTRELDWFWTIRNCEWFTVLCKQMFFLFLMVLIFAVHVGDSTAGNLYVSQIATGTVERFDLTGTPLGTFASVPNPRGIVFDTAGNLYVSEAAFGTVEWFDPSGTPLGTFATIASPRGLAFDVPEPTAMLLALLAAILVGISRRLSKNNCD